MRETRFIEKHQPRWDQLEHYLNGGEIPADFDFARQYRQVVHDLAMAHSRGYARPVIDRLTRLVMRGRQKLYHRPAHLGRHILAFFTVGFPVLVRKHIDVVLLSAVLLFGSLALVAITTHWAPDLPYSVVDTAKMSEIEEMYSPTQTYRLGRQRAAEDDILMFGFYIRNNIGIGFRTFASGLAFGLGSLFFLLFNGITIGAISGHLTEIGYIGTFWGFVAGHSAMELTAVTLSGAAGLHMGRALIQPGRKSRLHALKDNARDAIGIVYGAATMFVIAAFIEAFWSSRASLPFALKIAVGLTLWGLVILYFARQGREPRVTHAD